MSKLTDTQLVTLSKAAQREDRVVEVPASPGGRIPAMLKLLMQRGLVAEVPAEALMPVFRRDEGTNEPKSLIITELGLVAIGVTADLEEGLKDAKPSKAKAKAGTKVKAKGGKAARSPKTEPALADRSTGKSALVLKLLQRKEGASIEALTKATGWLPHSARAALTGLRKKGYDITRGKTKDDTTIYRVGKSAA